MEKNRKDYTNGKIYKVEPICDHKENEVYYGSTCQLLSKRMSKHRNDYKQWKNGKKGMTTVYNLFEKYCVENCKIYLVEDFPCERKDQLEKREGEIIKSNDCVNKTIAGRTKKEHYEDNKDVILQKKKEYYEDNKEEILRKRKEYVEINRKRISEQSKKTFICNCGSECRISDKSRHIKSLKHQNYLKTQTET